MLEKAKSMADDLSVVCVKTRALAKVFAEHYTAHSPLDEIWRTISTDPDTFVSVYSVLEDMILDIQSRVSDLTKILYMK